jgi:hypothetical protein
MGWAKSPACFCAATEIGRDTIDLLLREEVDLPEHRLEKFAKPTDRPRTAPPEESAEQTLVGVCMDNCILGMVENDERSLVWQVSKATLHAICSMFAPPDWPGHVGGKDPISQQKKLEKGDARFDMEKEILRFMLNGAARTVRLSETKAQLITEELLSSCARARSHSNDSGPCSAGCSMLR